MLRGATVTAPSGGIPFVLEALGTVHLVGVGGAGMSVVARLLAAHGVPVQGSDARDGDALAALRADGVRVWVGHDAAHVAGADTVVVSSAVRETNPELAAARAAGLRVLHRSQALAALMARGRSVAVAGAHGKTTTSAMIATVLRGAGLDPSFAIGGTVLTEDGPVAGGHLGSDVLVAEADESDGSFLNYAPDVAVVTNVEPDHLDHYGSRAAFEQAFVDFAARIVPGGTLVACADDAGRVRSPWRTRATAERWSRTARPRTRTCVSRAWRPPRTRADPGCGRRSRARSVRRASTGSSCGCACRATTTRSTRPRPS